MKVKIKKVYYCDFCKKHSLRSIELHEKHCTNNPNRECRLCGRKEPLIEIVQKLKDITSTITLEDVKNEFDEHCPVCVLAIIRLVGLNKFPKIIEFNYKEELQKWWDAKNTPVYEDIK